ncbi:tetratricopeptide repeat protein [Thermosporothrix hazakensis]|uniref:Tetratricopeptide repeat protein n=2 Tax=Thermosporothrix TaxID=768650 RepID=A0A326UCZ9_THEHA|nr:tetratricopeptide repeat protein [Thermosporothrix hazakensis]PZW34509.1 tetratricopeptide repeat protein [Thermosporothrix hazakensis]BBH85631.1 hypothetical protein KTC_03820 [Thermosporothrix sp. COM3]GCE45940.1 hypothetical protein KTH_08090 [Thermosporothrix hazakensis]
MTEPIYYSTQVQRVRLALEDRQLSQALAYLQSIVPDDEQRKREIAYLYGWYYVLLQDWEAAIQALSPFVQQNLAHPGHVDIEEVREIHLEREKIAYFLLYLGIAALNLSLYSDASYHFAGCLCLLRTRRIPLPSVRIKAHYLWGLASVGCGRLQLAIEKYTRALQLCRFYHDQEEVPHVHYGLCLTHQLRKEYEEALKHGQEALQLYRERDDKQLEAWSLYLLGRTYRELKQYERATAMLEEALQLNQETTNAPLITLMICSSQITLFLSLDELEQAWAKCQYLLPLVERWEKRKEYMHLCARAYRAIGKTRYKQALRSSEKGVRMIFLRAASDLYKRAVHCLSLVQSDVDLALLYTEWAGVLEAQGEHVQAIDCWREAYQAAQREEFANTSMIVPV